MNGSNLQAFSTHCAGHARALRRCAPRILTAPTPEADGLDAQLRVAYARRFTAFHVRVRGEDRVYVDPRTLEALSDDALRGLSAHEAGHAADWLAAASERVLGFLPESWHRAFEGRMHGRREAFAERVAQHLAGEGALRALHREAAAALGLHHDAGSLPIPQRGLPPSLRLLLLSPGRRRRGRSTP